MSASVPTASGPARVSRRPGVGAIHGLVLLLVAVAAAVGASAVRTSTTFDEIFMVAAGARGVETGRWSLMVDHPPLMPLLYGVAVRAADPAFPPEAEGGGWTYDDRWEYARDFFFREGNDPRRLALLSRLVPLLTTLGLVVAAFLWADRIGGRRAALLAAFLVAFLPDVVAHGAVAYNDVPLALAYLLAAWALDAAVRRPSPARGAVAGAATATALGVKFSALALGPVAALLVALEWAGRDDDGSRRWMGRLAVAAGAGVVAGYAVLVLLYRGDAFLIGLEQGLRMTVLHASEGHTAPAWLLGATSDDGWWYWFPLAFLVKTPVALHLLLAVSLAGLATARPRGERPAADAPPLRRILAGGARGPVVALAVFGLFLLASNLNVGFRYALPALPPLLVLAGVGLSRFWGASGPKARGAVVVLLALYAGSTLSSFPWFLSYESEWTKLRGADRPALLDSSVDWGQGLLALRGWMEEEGVGRVRLAYFGSALPGAYGIDHEPLPGFLRLPPPGDPGDAGGTGEGLPPRWTVVSRTLLHGLYVEGDPYAAYRARTPDAVVGGSLLVFDDGAR